LAVKPSIVALLGVPTVGAFGSVVNVWFEPVKVLAAPVQVGCQVQDERKLYSVFGVKPVMLADIEVFDDEPAATVAGVDAALVPYDTVVPYSKLPPAIAQVFGVIEPLRVAVVLVTELAAELLVVGEFEMVPVNDMSLPVWLFIYTVPPAAVPPHNTILKVTLVPGARFCKADIPLKLIAV
jgi:hypothetical protein